MEDDDIMEFLQKHKAKIDKFYDRDQQSLKNAETKLIRKKSLKNVATKAIETNDLQQLDFAPEEADGISDKSVKSDKMEIDSDNNNNNNEIEDEELEEVTVTKNEALLAIEVARKKYPMFFHQDYGNDLESIAAVFPEEIELSFCKFCIIK